MSNPVPLRRLLLVVGIAATLAAVALGVLATGSPATSVSVKCPARESEDTFTGVCVPELSPSIVEVTTSDFGGVPEVDGVPCTGGNSYECIGLAEESLGQGPTPSPSATLTAQESPPSPTAPPTGQELTSSPMLPPPAPPSP
jgi:hypothetical protein